MFLYDGNLFCVLEIRGLRTFIIGVGGCLFNLDIKWFTIWGWIVFINNSQLVLVTLFKIVV